MWQPTEGWPLVIGGGWDETVRIEIEDDARYFKLKDREQNIEFSSLEDLQKACDDPTVFEEWIYRTRGGCFLVMVPKGSEFDFDD